ncbi:unnamed protein product [Prorocentrum cordatum]|uniref:EcxA zinc-binding domain-containing protein n=1 Tax=Prorocentrum cordatum TaxID=2364126 RepID=A0ABN9Q769_9DINO|nr:unnamed protein product [Polarella glacialis]
MQQVLGPTDLASSLYDPRTGGALPGFLHVFRPLADDALAAAARQKRRQEGPAPPEAPTEPAEHPEEGPAPPEAPKEPSNKRPERGPAQPEEGPAEAEPPEGPARPGQDHDPPDEQAGAGGGRRARGRREKTRRRKKRDPPPPPEGEEAVLIDITGWLASFASPALAAGEDAAPMGHRRPPSMDSDAHLVEARAFPQNFWLRYVAKSPGDGGASDQGQPAVYYNVAFCCLPVVPMVPRAKDRRVGFFETRVSIGGEVRVNEDCSVINRWNLERQGGHINYYVDPAVPKIYHETIRQGVESWNTAFSAAACGEGVLRCHLPGEDGFPEDYSRGDARYNSIYMTDSLLPVYGFGPSLRDFRTGELLVAHVLLGFSAFVEGVSRHSAEALAEHFVRPTCGCRAPLLDANHPHVLKRILSTVVHEVGHTLGLRHNFLAPEDGNTSVMAYQDDLDTSGDPRQPVCGGLMLEAPGAYDVFAIKYGYTPLAGEETGQRHPCLDLLANGQEVTDGALANVPRNPLFASDEDCGGEDPRVNCWNASVHRCGYDKLQYALHQRGELLELARAGAIFPETFAERLRMSYSVVQRHVHDALRLIGGSFLDAGRRKFSRCPGADALEALRAVVDFCVGPLARLGEDEAGRMMRAFPGEGYGVSRFYLLASHRSNVHRLLRSALGASRLERLEMQRAAWQEGAEPGSSGAPLATLDVLCAVAFQPGRFAEGLLHPFSARESEAWVAPAGRAISEAAADAVRAEAALALARQVNGLAHEERALAAVRAGAKAFIHEAALALKPAGEAVGLTPAARAHWAAVVEQLNAPPDRRALGDGAAPFMMLLGQEPDLGEEAPGPWQPICPGHGACGGCGRGWGPPLHLRPVRRRRTVDPGGRGLRAAPRQWAARSRL